LKKKKMTEVGKRTKKRQRRKKMGWIEYQRVALGKKGERICNPKKEQIHKKEGLRGRERGS